MITGFVSRYALPFGAALLLTMHAALAVASNDCKVMDPDLVGSYEGPCEGGYAHGKGIAKGKDSYEGEFVRGLQHGTGIYVWSNGARYEGQWANGRRHGEGMMRYSDGNVYEGSWRDGKRSGTGTLRWTGGDQYVGNWVNDKRAGHGTLTWPSGTVYVGEMSDGQPSGYGVQTWPNGARYTGEWTAGAPTGEGTLEFADGGKYVGEFYRGKEHGRGTHFAPNGGRLDGEWAEGRRTSVGAMTMPDGTRYDNWRSGSRDCRYPCDRPLYPAASVTKGEVGLVVIRFLIGEDGQVVDSEVTESSNYTALDDAALTALRKCRYVPYTINGRPTRGWATLEYLWTIEGQGQVEVAYELGTWGTATNASKVSLPLRSAYAGLSEAYKKRFRQLYEGLPDDIEPPYPIGGLEKLVQRVTQWQVKLREDGLLSMHVFVDADGVARSVDVLATPSSEMSRAVAAVAMRTPFKPASCAGKPCALPFPLQLRFTR